MSLQNIAGLQPQQVANLHGRFGEVGDEAFEDFADGAAGFAGGRRGVGSGARPAGPMAESAAARWGTAIVVVFDGADVQGAASRSRRLVTVQYSPAGVIADDVRDGERTGARTAHGRQAPALD